MIERVDFTREARIEVAEAQDWYNEQSPGLGTEFVDELGRTVERIAENALQFPRIYLGVRRARLRRFPYLLFFLVESDSATIIACFHASRDPREWQRRIRR